MWIVERLKRALIGHVRAVSWLALVGLLLGHMASTWGLLALAGEEKLIPVGAFPYYYMTTATTIGYGDLSPQTTVGRLVVAFFLMPGSVALFAAVLAKTSTGLLVYWRRHREGRMGYEEMRGHTVLVGWQGPESERLVRLLLCDSATDDEGLLVIAAELAENPRPDDMRFVSIRTYTDAPAFGRAAIGGARRIIVNPPTDDQTLAAVLSVMAHKPTAHVVAYFECEAALQLVKAHYPQVECIRPMAAEILARAAQDPGSSVITRDLLAADQGHTQYSLTMPDGIEATVREVAARFKATSGLLLGYRDRHTGTVQINPRDDAVIRGGALIYYLAERRIEAAVLHGVGAKAA